MANQLHIVIRLILSFVIVCSVWLTPPQATPSPSKENIQTITSIKNPLDAPAGVKVKTASQQIAPSFQTMLVRSISSFTKPTRYSEPYTETTELLQFCISLTKTASLTTSS
ncbi:MAG TPA: hypothetical protein DGH68_03770 [Bacteroidetes bacterium]|jgi:hypothetical protein|nr:hypothetical protein [Bacteroidota bacterium]